MKIYGKVITDRNEWLNYSGGSPFTSGYNHYALGVQRIDGGVLSRHNEDTGSICGCSGKANQLIGKAYSHPSDTMSWGYEGLGSDLTAAWLISQALWFDRYDRAMPEHSCAMGSHIWELFKPFTEIMLRHYKQFSVEVIANLPDEWEMDTEWIKAWVMEREKELEVKV